MPFAHLEAFGPRWRRNFLHLALGLFALLAFSASPVLAKKTPPAQPIDLNAATVKELEELPGIGPTTAKAIVDFRTRSGRFRRVNDLLVIRGISEAKLAKIRPYITIGPPPKPPSPPPPKKEKSSP
jgi:competence ComEA-like helix-hairpin-helix protein